MFTFIAVLFVIGYLCIVFEHKLHIDKAAFALLAGVLTWVALAFGAESVVPQLGLHGVVHALREHLGEISEILFFLIGAMTLVEMVDAHKGFAPITNRIQTTNRAKLLWVISIVAFFLSSILDNLTTTIVMISLLRKLIDNQKERWFYAGMVVVAANAGGAWTPIGDVTTTMLWIGEQITTANIMKQLFLPSLISVLVPLIFISLKLKGDVQKPASNPNFKEQDVSKRESLLMLSLGLGGLIFVPIFKSVTHLPPYMGMLFSLAVTWAVSELLHRNKSADAKSQLTVQAALRRIDIASILFFLGILTAVSALQTAGHLYAAAAYLKDSLGNVTAIATAIGLLSAIVDNVPLVAACMNMYDIVSPEQLAAAGEAAPWMQNFVQDGMFWELLAFCAGTGGSLLIIGSAAGVAAMGMEKIDFFWYMKTISLWALPGYFAGIGIFMLQLMIFH
jgi:Na+/H+ antiporter NhaD/arsenite permease-like protein